MLKQLTTVLYKQANQRAVRGSRADWRHPFINRRFAYSRSDRPDFVSIVDNPPILVRTGQKHGPGLILLGGYHRLLCDKALDLIVTHYLQALMPITAFALGTWQIDRLNWKTKLIAKYEDRLVRDPLPLPPKIDPDAIAEFDYRRVYAKGYFRHDREMLLGPRIHEGQDGYCVITPLDRGKDASSVLVNRGWISKKLKRQADRKEGLPTGEVTVEGLLRAPWKRNMFSLENKPEKGEFYFPDVDQMAALTGCQPVWIEETTGRTPPHRPRPIELPNI